jgi:hypothetical protein
LRKPSSKKAGRVVRKVLADGSVREYRYPAHKPKPSSRIAPNTLEAWPLTWRHVNGKAFCETAELFALAEAKLNAAPPVRGGRSPMAQAAI